jgi:hypothetical protein
VNASVDTDLKVAIHVFGVAWDGSNSIEWPVGSGCSVSIYDLPKFSADDCLGLQVLKKVRDSGFDIKIFLFSEDVGGAGVKITHKGEASPEVAIGSRGTLALAACEAALATAQNYPAQFGG